MNKLIRFKLLCILIVIPFFAAAETADDLQLLTHTSLSDVKPLVLPEEQRLWLEHKKVLRVGVYNHDSPPFSLISVPGNYEGLNTDYLSVISKQLGLQIQLVTFRNMAERLHALQNGEIDIIPNSNAEYDSTGVSFTVPYSVEHPVLAVSINMRHVLPDNLDGVTVAVTDGYWPLKELKKIYPTARFQVYDNYQEALSAVAFGKAQVYLGTSASISQNFLNNIRVERFALTPPRNNTFAVNKRSPLLSVINSALDSMPPEKKLEMQEAWFSNDMKQINQPLNLTEQEKSWISQHPEVNVLLYGTDNTAPVAFIDSDNVLRGVAADVLNLVTIKTGLRFSFKTAFTLNELESKVNTHEADMIAALAPSDERGDKMLFTYPYIRSAFSLITRKNNEDINKLSDLRGKKLGLVKGAALTSYINDNYPEIKLVIYNNDEALFRNVIDGNVDAIMALLITSDYQISTRYRESLKIANVVGSRTAYISFALGKDSANLRDILNQVLTSLPPEELSMMANRWRPNNLIVVDDFWSRNRSLIYAAAAILLIMLILLILFIFRTVWLRRSIAQAASQVKALERILDDMPFPITLRDLHGRLKYCNKYYLALVGYPFEKIKDKLLTDQPRNISYEQARFFHDRGEEIMVSGKPYNEDLEVSIIDSVGNEEKKITVNIWMLPWRDASGKITGVIGGLWDVSERASLLKQLSEASDRAESSNRAKSTFLSTMSHEIRTPMNAIIGMLDMAIKQGREGTQDLQALEVAQQSAEGLVGLIGDILDLSRVEGGELEFRPERINLGTLISQLLVIFNGLAIDKNILLHKNFPPEKILDVIGDPLRIKQVLSNILGNAIKFTDTGSVTLDMRQEVEEDGEVVRYIIDVTDSGVGIDEAQQAKLFQPFSQAENRRAGTGLGLYISRNLCQSMGGDMSLYSVQHQGTRVRAEIVLPAAQASEPAIDNRENNSDLLPEQGRQLTVLVVDDNAANRMLLAKQLAWLGHHAHIAEGGEEALELWYKYSFDVIITDCNMPRMNGYQFTQNIRRYEKTNGQQPVWILGFTANAMHEIIERCLAAGMNGCLFKPCTINSLSEALNHRGKSSSQAPEVNLSTLTSQDSVLQQELMQRLEISLREDYAAMSEAYSQTDWHMLAHLAHRVMGSLRIMRESTLAQACHQLELACLAIPLDNSVCDRHWLSLKKLIEKRLANGI